MDSAKELIARRDEAYAEWMRCANNSNAAFAKFGRISKEMDDMAKQAYDEYQKLSKACSG